MESFRILYEEKDFVAVYKPAGALMHSVAVRKPHIDNGETETLADWICKRYPEIRRIGDDPKTRPGIVHRLDRATSGVVLVARTASGFSYLKSLFQERKIKKTYLAVVWGKFLQKKGTIDKPLGLKKGTTRHTIHGGKMVKHAITDYKVIRSIDCGESSNMEHECSLIEVYPRTGRTHQIRVHFASIGHPIVGDVLYGKKDKSRVKSSHWFFDDRNRRRIDKQNSRLMLHALSLEFTCPSGSRLKIEAETPEEFESFCT